MGPTEPVRSSAPGPISTQAFCPTRQKTLSSKEAGGQKTQLWPHPWLLDWTDDILPAKLSLVSCANVASENFRFLLWVFSWNPNKFRQTRSKSDPTCPISESEKYNYEPASASWWSHFEPEESPPPPLLVFYQRCWCVSSDKQPSLKAARS